MINFYWNVLKTNIFLIDTCGVTFIWLTNIAFSLSVLLVDLKYLRSSWLLRRFHQDMFISIVLNVPIFVYICLSAIKSRLKITHFMINNII